MPFLQKRIEIVGVAFAFEYASNASGRPVVGRALAFDEDDVADVDLRCSRLVDVGLLVDEGSTGTADPGRPQLNVRRTGQPSTRGGATAVGTWVVRNGSGCGSSPSVGRRVVSRPAAAPCEAAPETERRCGRMDP